MIRIAIVDDHPALVAGLTTVLRTEPGLIPVGSAAGAHELWPLLYRTRPDLVLLDYHLPSGDGLQLCHRIKQDVPAPRVIIYSAYADASLAVASVVAGADGLANKATPARELFEVVRRVAAGERVLPRPSAEVMQEASSRLDDEDLPLLGLLMGRTTPADITATLRLRPGALEGRVQGVLSRLRLDMPALA